MTPGTEVSQVSAELDAIASRLSSLHPESNESERFSAVATSDVAINPAIDRALAPMSLVLMGAVGLVLVVACANLANMLLARGSARRREMAIRLSLGANRSKLVRQLLLESLTIALSGGLVAIPLSYVLAGLIGRFPLPFPFDSGLDIAPDARVMGFTFVVAAATGIMFGLFPALQASRPDLVPEVHLGSDGKAADQEAARYEQHRRNRDLHHHQYVSQFQPSAGRVDISRVNVLQGFRESYGLQERVRATIPESRGVGIGWKSGFGGGPIPCHRGANLCLILAVTCVT